MLRFSGFLFWYDFGLVPFENLIKNLVERFNPRWFKGNSPWCLGELFLFFDPI